MTMGFVGWKPWAFARLPDAEMRQLALDLLAGQLVTSDEVPERSLRIVFMTFGLFAMQGGPKFRAWVAAKPGLIYGHLRKHRTSRTAFNGWPIFWECAALSVEDRRRLYETARKLQAAVQGVEV